MNRLSIWPWGKGAKNRKEAAREEKVDEGKSRGKVAGRWARRYTSAVPKTILNARLAIRHRADIFGLTTLTFLWARATLKGNTLTVPEM